MTVHARLSPSSASRWAVCTASAAAQDGVPNEGSDASRYGTAGHQMLEDALLAYNAGTPLDLQTYLGRRMAFPARGARWVESFADLDDSKTPAVLVDQPLIDAAQSVVDHVIDLHTLVGGELYPEQRLPIDHITGEEGACGTSDVVLRYGDVLHISDAKFGRGRVEAFDVMVPAHEDIVTGAYVPEVVRPNLQLALYALGALREHGREGVKHIKLTILQPFLHHVGEWSGTVEELEEVGRFLSHQAEETRTNPQFVPSVDACHFCRASGNCKAQTEMVASIALEGFGDEAQVRQVPEMELGQAYALLQLVYDWAKAIEQRTFDALQAGKPVVRADGVAYKLVEGRKGDRAWADPVEAEAALKKMRLKDDQMYTRKLVSPAAAEKLAKAPKARKGEEPVAPVLGPTQWKRLQTLITQGDGKPAVALQTDPRPALPSMLSGFEDVPPADNSDLF